MLRLTEYSMKILVSIFIITSLLLPISASAVTTLYDAVIILPSDEAAAREAAAREAAARQAAFDAESANGDLSLADIPDTGIAVTWSSIITLLTLLILAGLMTRQVHIVHTEQKKIKKLKKT